MNLRTCSRAQEEDFWQCWSLNQRPSDSWSSALTIRFTLFRNEVCDIQQIFCEVSRAPMITVVLIHCGKGPGFLHVVSCSCVMFAPGAAV